MKILVTGATGYIGSAVCEALKAAGHQPAGLARSEEKAHLLESRGLVARRGDLTDLDSLRRAVEPVDGVIHAADAAGPERGAIASAAVGAMLTALAGSNRRFVYTSGVWVVGDTDGRMVGEICALHPPPFVAWRPAVETMVQEAKHNGVRTVVLRPGMVYGRRGGALAGFFHDAKTHGAVRIIGKGSNHWSNIHIDDLADLFLRAVTDPPSGEIFFACGGMPQPVEKIARAVAKVCGVEGKIESVPLEDARAAMGPIADCLAMDCRAGSTKPARYFGWTVYKPSIFDEILSGSYLS